MTAVTARRVAAGIALIHTGPDGEFSTVEVVATRVDTDGFHVVSVDLGWTVAPIRFTPGQRLPLARPPHASRSRSGAGTRHDDSKETDQ